MSNWLNRVADYFLTLESASDELDGSIQQIRLFTQEGRYAEIEKEAGVLQDRLQRLDGLIADRQTLLEDPGAPPGQRTLRAALTVPAGEVHSSTAGGEDATMLLKQCVALGQRMEQIREHAIALFVCQYHLSETTDQILRLMFPQAGCTGGLAASPHAHRGGRLLDEAG